MNYEFEATDGSGERIEEWYAMAEAPPLGHTIQRGGRRWRRVVSDFADYVKPERRVTAWQQPKNYKYAKMAQARGVQGISFSKSGTPQYDSWRAIREVDSLAQANGESMTYDSKPIIPHGKGNKMPKKSGKKGGK